MDGIIRETNSLNGKMLTQMLAIEQMFQISHQSKMNKDKRGLWLEVGDGR